jgi:hypothetical protein
MNLKWLKQHSLTVGFVAAFVVVLGVLVWLQKTASSKRAEVDAALEEQQSQYDHLNQQKVAPSRENIDATKRDREQLDRLYGQLLGSVSHKVEVPADMHPVDFLQLMASSIAGLRQAAQAAQVKLPEGFAFGFSRYVGTLPARNLSPEDTKRVLGLLVKQLTAIDHISLLLMSNQVAEIDQIRRADVEPGGAATGGATTGSETLESGIKTDANALYQVLPFEFEFKCAGNALRAFLNSLTKADLFFAVRRLQITGEAPTMEKTTTGAAVAATAAAPTVSKTPLLTVTVRIDLIEFAPAQPAKKEAGKPHA